MALQPLTLTAQQRDEFDQTGALRLPGYFPRADMAVMADATWADMHLRFGIDRGRPQTWTVERPGKFQALMRSPAMAGFNSARLTAIGDAFLGAGRWTPPARVQAMPMVTFAAGRDWALPHHNWHLDISASLCLDSLPCIRVFTFLEPSRPRGGGTCYVSGSHRLAVEAAARTPGKHLHSPDVRAVLAAEHSWFADLFKPGGGDRVERFMEAGAVAGRIEVRACEMTGEVGDVILIHPATLHSIAVNELRTPRMMLMTILGKMGPGNPPS